MLFLSLVIYIIILPVYYFLIAPLTGGDAKLASIIAPFALFFLSFVVSLGIVYMAHAFHPALKVTIRNLVRIPGAKWIAFTTVILSVISLIAITASYGTQYGYAALFLPVIVVSILNALNIDYYPKMLADEQIAPKLVTLSRPEPIEIEKDILKSFVWQHNENEYKLSLVIRKSIYDHYKSKNRVDCHEWASEYAAGGICGEVRELAFKLMQIGKPYGTHEEVTFVLSFVQQALQYELEEGEYPRYPVESLVDGVGDCEDFSILGASILKLMGYEVALLVLPTHVALGVAGTTDIKGASVEHDGNRYFYCEMTDAGWQIGELPDGHRDEKIDVYPVPGVIIAVGDSRKTAAG